jgi:hypothetical protein
MIQILIVVALAIVFFGIWLLIKVRQKTAQNNIPLLIICEGAGLLTGGILSCVDLNIIVEIDSSFAELSGYIQSPKPNYFLYATGILLILLGVILWHSLNQRVYVLNMLGRVKHEISDIKHVCDLKIKEYQLKETILDARWAFDRVTKASWDKVKLQIEEYMKEFSARADAAQLCFTGMAPIPFEIYAGSCMTDQRVTRYFEYLRRDDKYYELTKKSKKNSQWPELKKAPSVDTNQASEVTLVVSITQSVQKADLAQFVGPIVQLSLDSPIDNVIVYQQQLNKYIEVACNEILSIKDCNQDINRINLVGAFPSCFAFDLGCHLNHLDNRIPEIISYHYIASESPKYTYGIAVTGRNRGTLFLPTTCK